MSRDVSYKPPGSTIVTVPLNPDLHKRLRIHAASEGCSIKSVVTQMIENRLAATPTPPTLPEDLREAAPSWRIAGQDNHFGPFVVVDGVPHDQVVLCYWRNQLQPIHLRLPGQAYVADLLRLMDENQCDEVAIIPARHSERVSLTRAALARAQGQAS